MTRSINKDKTQAAKQQAQQREEESLSINQSIKVDNDLIFSTPRLVLNSHTSKKGQERFGYLSQRTQISDASSLQHLSLSFDTQYFRLRFPVRWILFCLSSSLDFFLARRTLPPGIHGHCGVLHNNIKPAEVLFD